MLSPEFYNSVQHFYSEACVIVNMINYYLFSNSQTADLTNANLEGANLEGANLKVKDDF